MQTFEKLRYSKANRIKMANMHITILRIAEMLTIISGYFLFNSFFKGSYNNKEISYNLPIIFVFIILIAICIKGELVYRYRLSIFEKLKFFLEKENNINLDRLSILLNSRKFQNNDTKWIFTKLFDPLNQACRKTNDLNYLLNETQNQNNDLILNNISSLILALETISEIGFRDAYEDYSYIKNMGLHKYWFPEYKEAIITEDLLKKSIHTKIKQLKQLQEKYEIEEK